jgi:hypothetical protein
VKAKFMDAEYPVVTWALNSIGSSLFGVGSGQEKQATPKKL